MFDSLHGKTYLHWVPGHTNTPGNEYANRAAKKAAKYKNQKTTQPQSVMKWPEQ
jgi:ribonuclease HI